MKQEKLCTHWNSESCKIKKKTVDTKKCVDYYTITLTLKKTVEFNMKIAACFLSAKQPLSFFQHFDQNCNKPNNKPYRDHLWRLLLTNWALNEDSYRDNFIRYRISFEAKSYFDHCLSSISFAILAVSVPLYQANFIGCHKGTRWITKRLRIFDRPIGFPSAKHSQVYKFI